MNVNILRYSFFGIAGGQEVDHTFVKFIIYPLTMIASKATLLRHQPIITVKKPDKFFV